MAEHSHGVMLSSPDYTESSRGGTCSRQGGGRGEILVIASLIDKAPNLAGLARTCEVFQATQVRKLAMCSIKLVQDQGSLTLCHSLAWHLCCIKLHCIHIWLDLAVTEYLMHTAHCCKQGEALER